MRYFYKLISLFTLFIFSTNFALSDDIYEGQYLKSSIINAYSTGLNYYLPPGEWQVTVIDDDSGGELKYKNVTLWSDKNEYMYIVIPIGKSPPAHRWRAGGLKKCEGVKKKNIYTFAVKRGRVEGVFCVYKWKDDDSDDEWADVVTHIRTTSGNLKWTILNFATDYDLLNQEINERDRRKIAEETLDQLIAGFNGKSPSGASVMLSFFK